MEEDEILNSKEFMSIMTYLTNADGTNLDVADIINIIQSSRDLPEADKIKSLEVISSLKFFDFHSSISGQTVLQKDSNGDSSNKLFNEFQQMRPLVSFIPILDSMSTKSNQFKMIEELTKSIDSKIESEKSNVSILNTQKKEFSNFGNDEKLQIIENKRVELRALEKEEEELRKQLQEITKRKTAIQSDLNGWQKEEQLTINYRNAEIVLLEEVIQNAQKNITKNQNLNKTLDKIQRVSQTNTEKYTAIEEMKDSVIKQLSVLLSQFENAMSISFTKEMEHFFFKDVKPLVANILKSTKGQLLQNHLDKITNTIMKQKEERK